MCRLRYSAVFPHACREGGRVKTGKSAVSRRAEKAAAASAAKAAADATAEKAGQVEKLQAEVQRLTRELRDEKDKRISAEGSAEIWRNKYLISRGARPRPGWDLMV